MLGSVAVLSIVRRVVQLGFLPASADHSPLLPRRCDTTLGFLLKHVENVDYSGELRCVDGALGTPIEIIDDLD